MVVGRRWVLKKNFDGLPKKDDFELVSEELGDLEDGDILTETEFISVDPYQRPYSRGLTPPTTMMGSQVAKVIESKDPKYPVGSRVVSHTGWVEKAKINPSKSAGAVRLMGVTKAPEIGNLSPSLLLGACGMPGNTAYFGFLEICQPKKGENVFVNGAAGAVGSLVGQIAKIKGCKVVGSAGSDEKVQWLMETCGFDYAFNYKKVAISHLEGDLWKIHIDFLWTSRFQSPRDSKKVFPFQRGSIVSSKMWAVPIRVWSYLEWTREGVSLYVVPFRLTMIKRSQWLLVFKDTSLLR